MPPSPTVKDPKRMRKESGQRYDDPTAIKPVAGGLMTKIIGEGETDPYLMAAATANNFNQDSNMSSGTYLLVDMCWYIFKEADEINSLAFKNCQ